MSFRGRGRIRVADIPNDVYEMSDLEARREIVRLRAEVERLTAENRRLLLLSLEDMKNAGTEVAIQAALDDIEDREQLRAEVDRLKGMHRHCDECGGSWLDDGINSGCSCAELFRLRPVLAAALAAEQDGIDGHLGDTEAGRKLIVECVRYGDPDGARQEQEESGGG